jgi:long-chain acyl-CoA synthetase
MRGVDIKILDPDEPDPDLPLATGQTGHVAVRAASMFEGYLDAPIGEQPTEAEKPIGDVIDGYFLTGDLGCLDRSGALQITGRLKLLIDIGGVKVNPLEIEATLAQHPHVLECVVVPDPVTSTINRVKAILTADEASVDPDQLRTFLRSRLAPHKIPRTFEVRRTLPKSATGKVLRRELLQPA